jgi:hypothetical protein
MGCRDSLEAWPGGLPASSHCGGSGGGGLPQRTPPRPAGGAPTLLALAPCTLHLQAAQAGLLLYKGMQGRKLGSGFSFDISTDQVGAAAAGTGSVERRLWAATWAAAGLHLPTCRLARLSTLSHERVTGAAPAAAGRLMCHQSSLACVPTPTAWPF